ncbi:hypothetical protein [Rhizobium mayense]|uniref:Uncharacterized protein n=1 Tax=Rhizobium mayense TaxID=1312184 RepID=A0ABT7K0F3_9HYPH|nr:hypothetical protein [Rhizobium mayense]MDL2402091.1 hypothetical protein [Rhizobium mayense]
MPINVSMAVNLLASSNVRSGSGGKPAGGPSGDGAGMPSLNAITALSSWGSPWKPGHRALSGPIHSGADCIVSAPTGFCSAAGIEGSSAKAGIFMPPTAVNNKVVAIRRRFMINAFELGSIH